MFNQLWYFFLYTIKNLTDWIFPPSKNEAFLRTWSKDDFANLLIVQRIKTDALSLSSYSHPAIQTAVQSAKFEQSLLAASLLGYLVASYLNTLPSKKTLLIAIPLSRARERKRGFNQVARVITYVTKQQPEIITEDNILKRTKDTVPQTTLKRSDRLKNVEGIFVVDKKTLNKIINKHDIRRVIICDDVYTTGATMETARASLAPHLPHRCEFICIAWAH